MEALQTLFFVVGFVFWRFWFLLQSKKDFAFFFQPQSSYWPVNQLIGALTKDHPYARGWAIAQKNPRKPELTPSIWPFLPKWIESVPPVFRWIRFFIQKEKSSSPFPMQSSASRKALKQTS